MTTDETAAPDDMDPGPSARLTVTRILRADPGGLCHAMEDPSWLGRLVDGPSPQPGLRRVETDLAFAMTDDPNKLTFRKAAFVDVGVIPATGTAGDGIGSAGPCLGRVEWRASSFAPLFPVFSGTVSAHDGGLHLEGVYAPPGGGVGLLVDRTFLHHFAQRTAIWFLDRLIEELGAPSTT